MEEKSNMTAERSLEIISEQIAQTRQAVSQVTGQALYVSGLCTMGMAVVVAIVNFTILTTGIIVKLGVIGDYMWVLGNLLWLMLPVIIKLILRDTYEKTHAPVSLVGTLVKNTWWTFAAFAITYFIIAILWNIMAIRIAPDADTAIENRMPIYPVVILLMGMAISMTGQILKHKWLVWFGVIGGLVAVVGEHSGVIRYFIFSCIYESGIVNDPFFWANHILMSEHCLIVFLLALVGLMLPGLMLKQQSK